VAGPHGISTEWLRSLALVGLGVLTLSAVALPLTLRFGTKAPILMVLPFGLLGGVCGGIAVILAKHPALLFGVSLRVMFWIVVGLQVVLLLGGWVWTWLEIAYGRAIYRQWSWMPVSWRGQ
jgi:hypothetical protein